MNNLLNPDSIRSSASALLQPNLLISSQSDLTTANFLAQAPTAAPPALLDPLTIPKFVNPLPNPLDPNFIIQPTTPGGNFYEVGAYQTQQDLLGNGLLTKVWGYGTSKDRATYPGGTFVVQKGQPISVKWTNNLVDSSGNPLPHLLPVDSTVHWADPLKQGHIPGPYTGPVPIVTHLHGGHTAANSDGLPDAWFTPDTNGDGQPEYKGSLYNPIYNYNNDQDAATLWYHDHALGITRLNVYAGLAGFYILRDQYDTGKVEDPNTPQKENPLGLPAGPYEIPLVVQDRMFTADGQLYYPSTPPVGSTAPNPSVLPEFFGDTILVNGKAWPVLDVEPRQYRFRLLNGSDSRFYNFFFDGGVKFSQIGTDSGLLNAPVNVNKLSLAPGERADVILDFSKLAGKTLVMKNNAPGPMRRPLIVDPKTTGQIMAFRVNKPLDTSIPLTPVPATLRGGVGQPAAIAPLTPTIDTVTGQPITKQLLLGEKMDTYGRIQPLLGTATGGLKVWDDPVTEYVKQGSTEIWEIYNNTPDIHPIHLHQTSFQVLDRQNFAATVDPISGALSNIKLKGQPQAPGASEAGWKDTVQMLPGQVTRIIAKFDLTGEYVWHCHILSHEDNEMMRPFVVRA